MFVLNLRIGPLNPNYYNPSRINNSRSRQVNNYSSYLGNNFGLQGDYNYFGSYGNPFFTFGSYNPFYGYGNNDYISRNFWSWATGTPHPTNFLRSQGIPHGNYYSPWYSDQYGLISIPSYVHPFQNNRRGYNRPSVIDKFASMMDGINMPLQTFSSGPSEIDQMMNIMDGASIENSIYDMATNYVTIKIISNVSVSVQYNSNPISTITSA